MAELNFVVDQAALDTVKNTQLSANFAEMKEALTEFIEPYTQVIVSEDAISEAKADRAKINAVAKHIDDYRKLVKKVYTEPLKQFEDKCKELVSICDQGKSNIDYQLAEFEERRKEEKFVLLKAHFEAARMSMDNPEYITSSLALHPKWENKTTSLEECQKYMDDAIAKVDTEIRTILNLHSQWETSLLDDYSKNHDLVSALDLNERLTEKARQVAERRQEALRKEKEAKLNAYQRMVEESAAQMEAAKEATETASEVEVVQTGQFITEDELQKAISEDKKNGQPMTVSVCIFAFKVSGTVDDITAVKQFMDSKGIRYEELL